MITTMLKALDRGKGSDAASSPFFDREEERRSIEAAIRTSRPELLIVYGRRGAGKSYLFERVLARRTHFSYTCTERVMALQVDDIERELDAFAPGAVVGHLTDFDSFLDALAALARRRRRSPLIAVIDEFPYLARAEKGVLTDLQRWFNVRKRERTSVKVFLLGSMVSWMEEQALSDTAALKSVRTGQLAVHPLGYRHAAGFYPSWSAEDKVRAYAAWGGLPGVLTEIDRRRSIWWNLAATTLTRGAKLYDEPDWLKYTDLRGAAAYTSIVRSVASGDRRPSEIASRVLGPGGAQNQIQKYLDPLLDAQIIERRTPLLPQGERPKTSLYYVMDHFLAYWYRFVNPDRTALERRRSSSVLARIRKEFDKYVSENAFESVARAFLWEALADRRLPRGLVFDRVGAWWSGRGEEQDEADVVAYAAGELTLIGECKWTTGQADARDLQGVDKILRDLATELRPSKRVWRALFSRGGFSPELQRLAKDPSSRLLLVAPADLYW